MASRKFEGVAGPLQSLLVLGSASGLSDGQLLDRFAKGETPAAPLAFEALVDRHGPMVWRVCRSVLRDSHDTQDAFQATFLVLVRKGGSLRDRDSLACWLHGVALRVARHARGLEARRRRLDRAIAVETPRLTRLEESDDLATHLHAEVGRLPERYRAAVVLCYLEGRTSEEAAQALGWPVGTVKSRLSRAREKLRGRLTRLGLAPELPPSGRSDATVSPRLVKQTTAAATEFRSSQAAQEARPGALILAKGALKAMTLAKLKIPALALIAAGSCAGMSAALTPSPPAQEPTKVVAPSPQTAQQPAPQPVAEVDPMTVTVPRQLAVQSGSGTAVVYALDANGERIRDEIGPFKETERDLRWVVITGIVENQAIREAIARSRKISFNKAFPNYKRLDIQRQVRLPDETWSEWIDVEKEKNWKILDNLPASTNEVTPQTLRPPALVDSLPVLKKGTWKGVDPAALLHEPAPGLGVTTGISQFLQAPILALRSLDFTVEAGKTYRYRVRIVVWNPDFGQPRQAPAVIRLPDDRRIAVENPNQAKNLSGPWSEPTPEVKINSPEVKINYFQFFSDVFFEKV